MENHRWKNEHLDEPPWPIEIIESGAREGAIDSGAFRVAETVGRSFDYHGLILGPRGMSASARLTIRVSEKGRFRNEEGHPSLFVKLISNQAPGARWLH